MNWHDIIIGAITVLLGGGAGVAFIKGWFNVKLKRMDQGEKERAELKREIRELDGRLDNLQVKYTGILYDHTVLKADYEAQKKELESLQRKVSELKGYRSQQLKINRLTRSLSEYHKTGNVEKLVKAFEKELM